MPSVKTIEQVVTQLQEAAADYRNTSNLGLFRWQVKGPKSRSTAMHDALMTRFSEPESLVDIVSHCYLEVELYLSAA
jgi:hypothetical protein